MPNVQASAAVEQEPGSPPNHAAICGAKPNATFTSEQTRSPKQSILRALHQSPTMPLRNFEIP